MNTTLQRLCGSLLIIIGGLALVAPAHGADATISFQLPSGDTSGITAQTAPGVAGCISGCAWMRIPRGSAVSARRQAMIAFSAPAGTTIVNAAIRVRYRTRNAAVSAHTQSRIGGRWIDGRRLRSAGGSTTTVNAGRGATAVGITLTADGGVPARAVKSDAENAVSIESVQLTVRDLAPPGVWWTGSDPATDSWQRGTLCGSFEARDVGLGVDHVDYAVGAAVATVSAGAGTRLQPRPTSLGSGICIDSAQVGDGTFGTSLTAVDAGAAGNRSAAVTGLVRIDNTAPVVAYQAPTDPEARLPVAQLTVADSTSGVERIAATIDGLPAVVHTTNGVTTVAPIAPLLDGTHRIAWEAADLAGNVTAGAEIFGVADTTAPTIDEALPQGVSTAMAPVSAHAIDTGAGLSADGWRLAIDGIDVTGAAELSATGTITYLPSRPWSEGDHAVRVTAGDRSGNRTVRSWTFSLPITPPPPAPPVVPVAPPAPAADTVSPMDAPATTPDAAPVTRPAAPSLTLRAAVVRLRAGGRLRLHGSLAALSARSVRIEARVGTTWRLVVRVPVAADGRYAISVRLPQSGGYDVRARVGRTISKPLHLTAR